MQRAVAASFFTCACAHPSFLSEIPNGERVTGCDGTSVRGVGHISQQGGGGRNPFGLDFDAAGKTWTPELCAKDSDGDGMSNGEELGDPNCTWTKGTTPRFDTGITHPGQDCADIVCPDGSKAPKKSTLTGCAKYEYSPTNFEVPFTFTSHIVKPGTTHMQQAFTFPSNQSAMAVTKFENVIINEAVVHHIILYKCHKDFSNQYPIPMEFGKMVCNEAKYAWAMGGPDFCMPEGVAVVFQPGEHFMMEIHYDNHRNLQNVTDMSGIRMHGVPYVQGGAFQSAGTTFIGARLPAIAIPPNKAAHRATITIPASEIGIRRNGKVKIWAYMMHMHGIGKKQWLTAKASSGEEAEVACNANYDFDLQELKPREEPFEITHDMELTVNCVWDSTSRTEITHGGHETENEMCVVILLNTPGFSKMLMMGPDNIEYNSNGDKVCFCPDTPAPAPEPSDFKAPTPSRDSKSSFLGSVLPTKSSMSNSSSNLGNSEEGLLGSFQLQWPQLLAQAFKGT